jgi:hypothetical protein
MKIFKYCVFFVLTCSCVEPYEFVVHDNQPSLVVEGYISDKSYMETLQYPSDGRYFTIKLTQTGDVINHRSKPVTGALISLLSQAGEDWQYDESSLEPGIYQLNNDLFEAQKDIGYQLRIVIGEDIYESDWQVLPAVEVPPIGQIGFIEDENQSYVMEANEWMLRERKVITANISVPPNTTGEPIYYRWNFSPTWIYKAPLSRSIVEPGNTCWATEPNYLNRPELQIDHTGGYVKDLFTIPTIRNERIFEDFSVLAIQHALSEKNYFFWKEMSDQNEGSPLIDIPPFNLQSNIRSLSGKRVSGFFSVLQEQATRWYFNKSMLSYHVVNTLKADCMVAYGPGGPAPECLDCRQYTKGIATNVKPSWWRL